MNADLHALIPELPRSFELVEGELVQGETRMLIRYHVPDAAGEDLEHPGWYHAPVRETVDLYGAPLHVAWWAVHGWPKVAAWAR